MESNPCRNVLLSFGLRVNILMCRTFPTFLAGVKKNARFYVGHMCDCPIALTMINVVCGTKVHTCALCFKRDRKAQLYDSDKREILNTLIFAFKN